MITIYEIFRGKVSEQQRLRKLTYKDLAKMAGYEESSIKSFMNADGKNGKYKRDPSENVTNAIAKALHIEL